jgi:hypothetical protein
MGSLVLRGVALVLLLAAPALAQEEMPEEESARRVEPVEEAPLTIERIELGWKRSFSARLRAGAGAIDGDTITPGRGAMSFVESKVGLGLDRGKLGLDLPIELAHRQTFGAQLSETKGSAAARGTWRLSPRLRLVGELGVRGTWRPDWLDPFQPNGDTLEATDRFSHFDRRGMVEVVARPFRKNRLRLRYDYTLAVYRQDDDFDPIYDPNHLTPSDHDQHRVDLVWRWRGDGMTFRVGAEAARRKSFFTFARDGHTGLTHAGTGGEAVNPLLELRWVKPRVEGELELFDGFLQVGAAYEVEIVDDTFEGYQTYLGHHPELTLSLALPREIALEARTEMFRRRYGKRSYSAGPDHPMLEWGDRREDWIGAANLTLRVPFAPDWTAVASGGWRMRKTNYPGYTPNVWPASREYDFDWNYENWNGWMGVETKF